MYKAHNTTSQKNYRNDLAHNLKAKIFGQDDVIDTLVDYIMISAAGLNDKEKPIGSFLFTGPTGVGKTELAKELAKQLSMHFERFDMSEYASERSADNLIGGAAGLVGYQEGGLLTNAIIENPYSVVLFDEIEKADKSVLNKFLQIMDYGRLTSSSGEKVDFRNTIVIFTSNLGAIKTTKRTMGFGSEEYIEYESNSDEYLSPEFRARINHSIEFSALNDEVSKLIIQKYFNEINEMLEDKKIQVEITDELVDKFVVMSNKGLGARNLQKIITEHIKVIISREIISGNLSSNATITFDLGEDDLIMYAINTPEPYVYQEHNGQLFQTHDEALEYAKAHPGVTITREANGNGFISLN